MLDLWERLHPIFVGAHSQQPEIIIENLSIPTARTVIEHLLLNASDVQAALYTFTSEGRIHVRSLQEAVQRFTAGELIGGFLVEPKLWGLSLPVLGIFSEEPGYLSVDYETGSHWTPVALIALFEFFRMIKTMEPHADIHLSRRHFDATWQFRFIGTLREYLDETYK